MSNQTTYTGTQQAKALGLDKPLYDKFELHEIVNLKHMKGKYKIGWISSSVLVYVYKQRLNNSFSTELNGPFWCDELIKL